jgi:serine/threonine-protein kinase
MLAVARLPLDATVLPSARFAGMPIPERLGKYLIRRELGRGAMGVVYEGYDPLIERTVAVKVLRTDDLNANQSGELRQRFRREAQAAGRLNHPNIVSVYEYGEEPGSGQPFIAMEFVRGRDLKVLLDTGTRFTLAETGRLMTELLAALQHAHAQGVVHRDIKPGNIIVLDDGQVKVGDFGIAKLDSSELTQLGSVLGTVLHMSPEQLAGQPVDARSDLFSCGVVLYQLLTGRAPFTGSPATVVHQVLYGVPAPPSSLVRTLPPGLDAVVERALAKQPGQRHPSAQAFAASLRAALDDAAGADATVVLPGPPAPPSTEAQRPVGWRLGVAALLAAAGGGALWWLATRDAGETPRVAHALAPPSAPVSVAPPATTSAHRRRSPPAASPPPGRRSRRPSRVPNRARQRPGRTAAMASAATRRSARSCLAAATAAVRVCRATWPKRRGGTARRPSRAMRAGSGNSASCSKLATGSARISARRSAGIARRPSRATRGRRTGSATLTGPAPSDPRSRRWPSTGTARRPSRACRARRTTWDGCT